MIYIKLYVFKVVDSISDIKTEFPSLRIGFPVTKNLYFDFIQIQAYSSKFMPIHAAWANVGFDLKNRFPVPKNIYFDI